MIIHVTRFSISPTSFQVMRVELAFRSTVPRRFRSAIVWNSASSKTSRTRKQAFRSKDPIPESRGRCLWLQRTCAVLWRPVNQFCLASKNREATALWVASVRSHWMRLRSRLSRSCGLWSPAHCRRIHTNESLANPQNVPSRPRCSRADRRQRRFCSMVSWRN